MSNKGYRIPAKKKELRKLAYSYSKKLPNHPSGVPFTPTVEEIYWMCMLTANKLAEYKIKFLKPGEEDSAPYYTLNEMKEKVPKMCLKDDKAMQDLLTVALSMIPNYVVDYLEEYCFFKILEENTAASYLGDGTLKGRGLITLDVGIISEYASKDGLDLNAFKVQALVHECAHCYLQHDYSPFACGVGEKQADSLTLEWLREYDKNREKKKCPKCGHIPDHPAAKYCSQCAAELRKEVK